MFAVFIPVALKVLGSASQFAETRTCVMSIRTLLIWITGLQKVSEHSRFGHIHIQIINSIAVYSRSSI